jgi:iron complex outermembrane receptor protein
VVTAAPPVGLSNAAGRSLIDAGALGRVEGTNATDAIADLTATVDSTRQGMGRNKLFVRGLADSAMNGPLQATVGQYFGDLRLSYGSPDPDLALVDIRRVEVFEGPQGTRFGIGAIGGILRLQPEPPSLDETSGRLVLGGGVTSGGAESGDVSLVLNRPLGDRAAGRIVAYARRDGGFLDNPALGLREKDGVDTVGGRAGLRWNDGTWTIDLTGLVQRASADDSQTVATGETRFTRASRITEPYESAIGLVGVTARRRFSWGGLTSATSVSRQTLDERFDASQPGDVWPGLVDRRQKAISAASELRLDIDATGGWTWSGGAAFAVGETTASRRRRSLSPDPVPDYGVDLTRTFAEATVFGEASLSPAPDWRIAAGARLSVVNIDTDLRNVTTAARMTGDLDGATVRLSPSLSARWDVSERLSAFGRLEQAVRPAGVREANDAFSRYQGDRVTLAEIGLRTRGWNGGLSGEGSIGWVDWRDVQADIVTPGGDLVTDNVGDGLIQFVSIKASWTASPTLEVSGGLFVNDSRLTATRFSIIGGGSTAIPNVAPVGAQFSVDYQAGELAGQPLRLGADLRYIGQSRLGVGPSLDVPQGGYLRTELTARLGDEWRAMTLRISNPFDRAGVRYGIGSPYQLYEPQSVPVRPLTIRLGFEAAF